MLREIVKASVNATDLCDQMLAYAGSGASATEIVDYNSLVRDLAGLLQVTLSKKATLSLSLHEDFLGVLGDRGQFGQVVMNLITNASEAIGDNAGRAVVSTDVEVSFEDRAGHAGAGVTEYVQLTVSDTGRGMHADEATKIFDPFFTTKLAGRGLGLAAVQGIVRIHGGTIETQTEAGVGTTFIVRLPRTPLPQQIPEDNGTQGTQGEAAAILVVDDEPSVRAVLTDIFESSGYDVLCASDGAEAIELYRSRWEHIDCVLLDLNKPELGGEEVFAELRRICGDARVILSSGYTEQEMLDRFSGAGLAGVIHKPARMQTLLDTVAAVVAAVVADSRSPTSTAMP